MPERRPNRQPDHEHVDYHRADADYVDDIKQHHIVDDIKHNYSTDDNSDNLDDVESPSEFN